MTNYTFDIEIKSTCKAVKLFIKSVELLKRIKDHGNFFNSSIELDLKENGEKLEKEIIKLLNEIQNLK